MININEESLKKELKLQKSYLQSKIKSLRIKSYKIDFSKYKINQKAFKNNKLSLCIQLISRIKTKILFAKIRAKIN